MSERPVNDPSKKGLRAFLDWVRGTPVPESPGRHMPVEREMPTRIGHYTIERKLGQGGMGTVFAARDGNLHRQVALKTMRAPDETARQRFWREARAAASVNHPHVCQIYEIGDADGELFIAMELLSGTSLAERLKRGPFSASETIAAGLEMLAALAALHERGIVHRDLKPSNVFLTAHGIKLLDFGLARPSAEIDHETVEALTRDGAVIGTPHYMSPEQALGQKLDARSDLFASGAILFEMLAGRQAFAGATIVAALHATIYEEPPALSGSPAVVAIDRVIRRALAKKPDDRYPSAHEMAADLRTVSVGEFDSGVTGARAMTRVVVLPFRQLRPDDQTGFLAFSLPDAIASALSGIPSLIVRSTAVAARYAVESPDFKVIAAEAAVDRVVMGNMLRAGDELRVSAQLVEAPSGTMIAAHVVQMSIGDLFKLQDDLVRKLMEGLALPLGGEAGSSPDRPRDPRAYELYLRGNELARSFGNLEEARGFYEQALALDPLYAPAWARLGRCHRLIGKYIQPIPDAERKAEEAYHRALELNPRLTVAHKLYAALEAELGQAERGMIRLLGEATRHGNDAELFAGLVHACRYCGLLDESLAAHAEARRLDPGIPSSVLGTYLLLGDDERVMKAPFEEIGNDALNVVALGLAGRRDAARQEMARLAEINNVDSFRRWAAHLTAWLDRRVDLMEATVNEMRRLSVVDDPEAQYLEALFLCDAGAHDEGLRLLELSVSRGYCPVHPLRTRPQFEPIRASPQFARLVSRAETGADRARKAFVEAGGPALLGRRVTI